MSWSSRGVRAQFHRASSLRPQSGREFGAAPDGRPFGFGIGGGSVGAGLAEHTRRRTHSPTVSRSRRAITLKLGHFLVGQENFESLAHKVTISCLPYP